MDALRAGFTERPDGVALCRIELTAILAIGAPGCVVLSITESGSAAQTYRLPPAAASRIASKMLEAAHQAQTFSDTVADKGAAA